jgi:NADP-dependent 3-hydroxy acid dehydrogenase YdfG
MEGKKVALITGGGTGIGSATAELLASRGVDVVILGRRVEPLEATAERIAEKGGIALVEQGDVTDFPTMESVVNRIADSYGKIDLVISNASVHDHARIHDGDPNWWRTLILINVVGLLNTVRASLPKMYEQGFGHIIVVSSLSGRVTYVGEPVYAASKHAQVAFVDCLRQEVIPKGIKVSIVEPGVVDTPMLDRENPVVIKLMETVTPLEAEEVAEAIRFIYEQSSNCVINELSMRPLKQDL